MADISPDLLERCHSESATISSHLELCGAFKCGRRSQARSFESHTPETSQPGFLASLPYQLNSVCQHVHGATRKADGERERERYPGPGPRKRKPGALSGMLPLLLISNPHRGDDRKVLYRYQRGTAVERHVLLFYILSHAHHILSSSCTVIVDNLGPT